MIVPKICGCCVTQEPVLVTPCLGILLNDGTNCLGLEKRAWIMCVERDGDGRNRGAKPVGLIEGYIERCEPG